MHKYKYYEYYSKASTYKATLEALGFLHSVLLALTVYAVYTAPSGAVLLLCRFQFFVTYSTFSHY